MFINSTEKSIFIYFVGIVCILKVPVLKSRNSKTEGSLVHLSEAVSFTFTIMNVVKRK